MRPSPEPRHRPSLPSKIAILTGIGIAASVVAVVSWRPSAGPEMRPLIDAMAPWVPPGELDASGPHDSDVEAWLSQGAKAAIPFDLITAFTIEGKRSEHIVEGLAHLRPVEDPLTLTIAMSDGSIVHVEIAGEIVVDVDGHGPLSRELILNFVDSNTVSCSGESNGSAGFDSEPCTFYPKTAVWVWGPREDSCWSAIETCKESVVATTLCDQEGERCWVNYLTTPPEGIEFDCGAGKVEETESGWCVYNE